MLKKIYKELELSTQIIINGALKRGIEVDVLDWDDNFIRLKKGNKVEYIKQATRTSADTCIAHFIMENKEVTKTILSEHGINVPESATVKTVDEAEKKYPEFIDKDIVIKPKSTNFGEGITILKKLRSEKDYMLGIKQAFSYDRSVMIEEFIPGKEYRFLVIGDTVAAILHRIPANVVGNGSLNIKELVDEKNKDPMRGKDYVTPLEKIVLGTFEKNYLRSQGKDINYVPVEGEIIYLRENSNLSTGGDSIDFTDNIIDNYNEIAVKSAKAVGAKICGADIIISDVNAKPNKNNHSIIELNFNPILHAHAYPYKGQNRHVEDNVLDILGF
jgi:glutamate--cysteine ligase/glutathione synthase